MKKSTLVIILGLLTLNLSLRAQDRDTTNKVFTLSARDSVLLDVIHQEISALKNTVEIGTAPRFKMYKTENLYNLLKLDTATGAVWMVQYGMNNNASAGELEVDSTSLLWSWETPVAGRYELYPTKNMYNFILLDTLCGTTYQVQWSTKPSEVFRRRIY